MNNYKKTALITGSTRGIGLAIAQTLKENDMNIFLTGRDEEKLKQESKKLECPYFVCDLTKIEAPQNLFSEFIKHYNTIDILINNAGLYEYNEVENASNIENMLNVNIKTPFELTKLAVPYMKKQRWGRIIKINPGWVKTDMGFDSMEESDFPFDLIPQRRFVEPCEIAKLILFLISEDARGITGQSINLCAGLTCGI